MGSAWSLCRQTKRIGRATLAHDLRVTEGSYTTALIQHLCRRSALHRQCPVVLQIDPNWVLRVCTYRGDWASICMWRVLWGYIVLIA